ncbi:UNVERIFIED_CONTAM: hypothetical protein Sindi_1685200, partial [Sesamum indicum]
MEEMESREVPAVYLAEVADDPNIELRRELDADSDAETGTERLLDPRKHDIESRNKKGVESTWGKGGVSSPRGDRMRL